MLHAAVGEAESEAEVAVGSVGRRSRGPDALAVVGRRGRTNNYAPIEPTGTEPAFDPPRRLRNPPRPAGVSRLATPTPDAAGRGGGRGSERHPSPGSSRDVSCQTSVPLDEQIEVVGEQFYPKEIRKLFRDCGMPITAAGCTLDPRCAFWCPSRGTSMTPTPSRSWCEHSMSGIYLPPWPGATMAASSHTPSNASS